LPDAIVETATNAAGVIDVAGLPPGRYQISASQLDRIGTGTVDIVAGGVAAPGALQFAPVGELRGVANGADGRALPSAGLWIHKKDPRAAARERALAAGMLLAPTSVVYLTDRHGNFRIPFVAEGEWAVMLQPPIGAKPRAVAVASSSFTVEAGKVARVEVTAPQ
jgi:hypothetical protein